MGLKAGVCGRANVELLRGVYCDKVETREGGDIGFGGVTAGGEIVSISSCTSSSSSEVLPRSSSLDLLARDVNTESTTTVVRIKSNRS